MPIQHIWVSHSITSNIFPIWAGRQALHQVAEEDRCSLELCRRMLLQVCSKLVFFLSILCFTSTMFVHIPIQNLDIVKKKHIAADLLFLLHSVASKKISGPASAKVTDSCKFSQ